LVQSGTGMPTADEIRQRIEGHLPGSVVEVDDTTGTGDHFAARVTAPQFAGQPLLTQHRLVYAAVQDGLDDGSIHALSIKTQTAP
jgi:stress-induced morphogen